MATKSYTTIRDEIEQKLQDTGNATWSTGEIDQYIQDALVEIAEYIPHKVMHVFQIESRTGTATSTSAGKLVDSTEGQFLSTDVGKVVYNTKDNTFAVVTGYTDANTLSLSKDIFTSGESYKIFNKNCWKNTQINIEDVDEWEWIDKVVFETQKTPERRRNFLVLNENKVLEIKFSFTPDDTKETTADKDVYVTFAKKHYVTELTDVAGAVNNASGYSAGSTSMAIDGLSGTETIEEGIEFSIADCRGTYVVKEAVTLSGGAGTITFYPGLESSVSDDDVVTFKGSTLTKQLERLLIDLVASRAIFDKTPSLLNKVNVGGTNADKDFVRFASLKMEDIRSRLRRLKEPRVSKRYSEGR